MASQNVTLSLPDDLVRRAKVFAATRDTSMSALVGDLLAALVDTEGSYQQTWRAEEAFMTSGPLVVDKQVASRDELHKR